MQYRSLTYEGMQYLIRFPKGYVEGERYPVILFIHGAGGRGGTPEQMRQHPQFSITERVEDFPFVLVAPICPGANATWYDYYQLLSAFARDVAAADYTDPERLYLMGASMGGYTTWELAMSMPELFAAIVPICGGGMYWNAGRLVNVPIWAFHGKLDPTVLVGESEKMVNAVNKRGGNARLTVYPENKHDAWTDTFSNPEVYRWLLCHRNQNAKRLVNEYSGNAKDFG